MSEKFPHEEGDTIRVTLEGQAFATFSGAVGIELRDHRLSISDKDVQSFEVVTKRPLRVGDVIKPRDMKTVPEGTILLHSVFRGQPYEYVLVGSAGDLVSSRGGTFKARDDHYEIALLPVRGAA